MRYAMAIDIERCEGCHACAIACKSNNNVPNGIQYHRVLTDGGDYMDTARGTYPNDLYRRFIPMGCQHCAKPACVEVCPTGASVQRENGIVAVDKELCIGCETCVAACPYDARIVLKGEPKYIVDFALGDWFAPKHVADTVEKCNFCEGRLERGMVPACMELCPGRARFWGDIDDPTSEIAKLVASRKVMRLKESEGTEPQVYYLVK